MSVKKVTKTPPLFEGRWSQTGGEQFLSIPLGFQPLLLACKGECIKQNKRSSFGFAQDDKAFGCFLLLLRVVDVVVQSSALLAFHCLTHDKITYVNHIAQLAQFAAYNALLEQFLCLFVQ